MSDHNTTPELKQLRTELDRIDRELVERAAERQRIVSEIGRLKRSVGRQLRDFRREREVLDGVRAHAESLGLDPGVAERLLTTLIEASLTRQETERVALAGRGAGRRALVIGGAGRLGGWLVRFLDSQGFDALVADPATADLPGHYRDWHDAPLDVDVIVVAAPLMASRRVLDELIDRRPQALVFDVASVKAPLTDTLKRAAVAGLSICSIHPMFGPDTRLLAGRHVLLMDCGCPQAVAAARALFADTMAELVEVSLEQHDRLMAWVLGLSHALNLLFVATLAETGAAAEDLAAISSTTFQRQLELAGAVSGESPELYFEIQHLNPANHATLDGMLATLTRIHDAVSDGDSEAFSSLMRAGHAWAARHRGARGGDAA
ncbi:MAG: prephenate dehydrogenase/arogenate dehydrogenase family protein [Wenzhouxiangellaceae bacterium]|nr:prephenate dehydrogenase/arogenate dehydrogenase family protein [Wenzhouxiangellaceae bacterium]